jgi:hypothetical protein
MKLRNLAVLRMAAFLALALVSVNSACAHTDATPSPTPGLMTKTLEFLHIEHAPSSSATPTPEESKGPDFVTKTLEVLHLKRAPGQKKLPDIHGDIELKLSVDPADIQLSTTRQVQATVGVYNRSSKSFIDLSFPTTQRVEVLVKDSAGKVVNTWSEDQQFTSDPATITINPGERLEYTASVATREMSPGQPYVVEVSFPSYPDLTIQQLVTARK